MKKNEKNILSRNETKGNTGLHTLLYVFALKTLLADPNAPLDVEISLHRP
jgi:hypothetical protein